MNLLNPQALMKFYSYQIVTLYTMTAKFASTTMPLKRITFFLGFCFNSFQQRKEMTLEREWLRKRHGMLGLLSAEVRVLLQRRLCPQRKHKQDMWAALEEYSYRRYLSDMLHETEKHLIRGEGCHSVLFPQVV